MLQTDTSRTKKWVEEDGKEYHFASREVMELNINHNRLLEYGEYKGHLYGTSIESVRTVIKSGKVCVLTLHPQVGTIDYIIFSYSIKLKSVCSESDHIVKISIS